MIQYWDTSVLLKLLVEEHDSAFFTTLIEKTGAVIHTSEISRLELSRALLGKRMRAAADALQMEVYPPTLD